MSISCRFLKFVRGRSVRFCCTGTCLILHPMNRKAKYRSNFLDRGVSAAKDLNTQHYLRLLVTILISFITTSILLYPEKFLLGPYPFSYLGSKTTPLGMRNIYARIVFDLGMFLCGYTMYLLARYYHRRQPVPDSHVYEFLSYISATGFVLMLVPCEAPQVRFLHCIGSGFVVGSHLITATIRVIAVHHQLKPWAEFILLTTLIISVLLYAALWLFNLPNNALFQKPAFAAIIYVELYGSSLSRYHGEQKVFMSLQSQHIQ